MGRTMLIGAFALQSIFSLTAAISLANFQEAPPGIPATCLLAYDSDIPSCTTADFIDGAACSKDCISGLDRVSDLINTACPHVIVSSGTLLAKVFQDQLVSLLCPNIIKPTSASKGTTTAPTADPTTKAKASTTPISSTTSVTTSDVKSTTSKPSSTPKSSSSSVITTTIETSSSSSSSSPTTSVQSSSLTETSASSYITSIVATSAASSSQAAKTSSSVIRPKPQSAQEQQIAAMQNSGGGSPFDIVVAESAGDRLAGSGISMLSTLLCLLWIGVLLR